MSRPPSPLDTVRLHLACGLGLLTRLPINWLLPAAYRHSASVWPMARSLWCWPLIGAVMGLLCGGLLLLAQLAHMPPLVAACLALTAQTILGGGLHEDGLADMADGCGGTTPARRLEIMRDSRVGSYGVMALCLSFGLRAASLASLPLPAILPGCLMAACLARAALLVPPAILPPARPDGLARMLHPLPRRPFALAMMGAALCVLAAMLLGYALHPNPAACLAQTVGALLVAALTAALVARTALRMLGGYTGDVLGACAVLTDTVVLTTLATLAQIPGFF
ncbi:adenosylcobinamide-GDP ribazoletransferase [Acetobacter suratthaniensis]|uniref:Adenosylcobinamide-GDP ribazoletransferase n=1 Tax=Acetobacter suratthaniensis TaxID=1502841 RepID=A0ABS3LNL6_9PROT|nr:adenosylcobinamide-GDP ribazoletransferase [Acetobacter suratthaniensis]MBO1328967.1 adenosylcobinamide-GDP ribazoletransferase [Acetobacter suratthaniensis]MCX2567115.1 adenosylcobinamide-GDP ribazoletransferase [Acetobacter suratthaniensis]